MILGWKLNLNDLVKGMITADQLDKPCLLGQVSVLHSLQHSSHLDNSEHDIAETPTSTCQHAPPHEKSSVRGVCVIPQLASQNEVATVGEHDLLIKF